MRAPRGSLSWHGMSHLAGVCGHGLSRKGSLAAHPPGIHATRSQLRTISTREGRFVSGKLSYRWILAVPAAMHGLPDPLPHYESMLRIKLIGITVDCLNQGNRVFISVIAVLIHHSHHSGVNVPYKSLGCPGYLNNCVIFVRHISRFHNFDYEAGPSLSFIKKTYIRSLQIR